MAQHRKRKFGIKQLVLLLMLFAAAGCTQKICPRTYELHHITDATINIDGALNEPAWKKAALEKNFIFPWEDKPAPLTEFRAFYDDQYFYFSFDVRDDNIVAEKNFVSESVVDGEDRVEIFFARSRNLKKYYCLEVDPLGRVHSYSAAFFRKLDSSWDCAELRSAATITEKGYITEAALPLTTFESLDLPVPGKDNLIIIGLFRADFARGNKGEIEKHWISWVDLSKEKPDFHIPPAFGCMNMNR